MQNIIESMNKYFTYLIAITSGLLGVFAFSPFDYWPLAYVSLFGLLYVAKNSKKSTALLAKKLQHTMNRVIFQFGEIFHGFHFEFLERRLITHQHKMAM